MKNKSIKKQEIFAIIFLILIISNIFFAMVNVNQVFAVNQTISEDINSIDSSKYPGVKEQIQQLKTKHPYWSFKILYTDIDWNEAIGKEYLGHGSSPKNLVPKTHNSSWICNICGVDKAYDNGSWRCASKSGIEYMMDPRNSINEADIFQFEELTSTGSDVNIVKKMTNGTFLQGREQEITNIANTKGVNAYYIVARLIQEQGKSGSELISGKTGYYNAFNFGASGSTSEQVIANGLAYAKKKGWDTLEKSISGGIDLIANEYIKIGQNTLYFQKFNVTNKSTFAHQYQQNLFAAKTECATLRNTYLDIESYDSKHTFIIPVFKNMPPKACLTPDGNSTATSGADLVKINVTTSLKLRKAPEDSTKVDWLWKNEIVARLEKGTTKINGAYWDKIQKANGNVGYAPRETFDYETDYKLYLVPINTTNGSNNNNNINNSNGNNSNNNSNNNENKYHNTVKVLINDEKKIIKVSPDAIAKDILEAFGGSVKITKADGSFLNGENDNMATNFIVKDTYTVIKKGDANADGIVNSFDYIRVMNYIMGRKQLNSYEKEAADANNDGIVNSFDYIRIMNYIMGTKKIELK
jgi:mannosyl-glycoprotein endo-beta-N-acetylglucosaminidase